MQFLDKLAKHAALRVFLIINLERNVLTFFCQWGGADEPPEPPPAYGPAHRQLLNQLSKNPKQSY